MRWGVGLHGGAGIHSEPIKREGDYSSPAGVFRLFAAFGVADPRRLAFLRFPYRQVSPTTEAIDDPKSKYYNRIIDRREIARPDWTHFEPMGRVGGRYRLGIMVEHNWEQTSGAGSCVFLHVWSTSNMPTAGCTAMSAHDLVMLLHWIEIKKQPLLVQLPLSIYRRFETSWCLPAL